MKQTPKLICFATILMSVIVTPAFATQSTVGPTPNEAGSQTLTASTSDFASSLESQLMALQSGPAVHVPKDELDFSNICLKPKLETIKEWYEQWLAGFFLKKPFTNMLVTSTSMLTEIESHVSTVQRYLAELQAYMARTNVYALHFMKAKMYSLVGGYSNSLGIEFNVKAKIGTNGVSDTSLFHEVIQNTQSDVNSIVKVSEVFYQDLKLAYGSAELQANLPVHTTLKAAVVPYLAETKAINKEMCGVLMNSVSLFAGDDKFSSVWGKLSSDADLLADLANFFVQFQYVLTEFRPDECGSGNLPKSVRGAISLAFIGRDLDQDLKTTFFSAKLFELLSKSTGFKEVLDYDNLLLVPQPSYTDLNQIRQISESKPGFSVEFINEFPSLDVSVLADPQASQLQKVHEVNIHLLLYRLYVLLRSDKFKLIKPGMSVMEIYNTIFQWMLTTNYFKLEVMPSTDIADISKSQQELIALQIQQQRTSAANQDLILVSEYIFYYPPLVTLLVSKLKLDMKAQTKEMTRTVEDLPILYEVPSVDFPKDAVHPEVVKIIDNNILKSKLGALSKAIKTMRFQETLKACTKVVKLGDTETSQLSLTFDCVKPFYEEWIKIFILYFSKLGDKDDIAPYINTIETSVQALKSKDEQDLINFCIILYFQLISQKDSTQIKVYERRAAERFLMKAITLMTADIGVDSVRGFTSFMVGASDYSIFGKYFKFQDSGESEFHAYNIFYIVLFAQLNEAKRLKQLGKDLEVKSVLGYKNELQKVFEKRYPNVVQLMSEDSKKRPLRFIKSIFKTQFFLNFLDFFDLFYLNQDAKAHHANPIFASEFISIHTVFINFYHFLYSLRNLVKGRIENPHEFVLEKMEACLNYASRPGSLQPNLALEEYCTFSDRKYAEMYYFYKLYLILKRKMPLTLANFGEDKLNTHTRMFFLFAINSKEFRTRMEVTCSDEASKWVDLCVSWVVFRDFHKLILDSTHRGSSFSYIRQFITEKVLPNPNEQSSRHVKFNILFAAEAISLLVDGKGVNYSRFISLFNLDEQYASVSPDQAEVGEDDKKVLALFQLKSGDTPNRELMIQYLKRTYFKKSRTSNEQAATLAIVSILDESDGSATDLLTSYFTFANHMLVNYIKLFLMYATRDDHYAKIADFLIHHNVFFELANLNRPEDDLAYKSILEKLALNDQNYVWERKNNKPTSQFQHDVPLYRKVLFNSLNKRYSKIFKTMSVKLKSMGDVDTKKNTEKSSGDFDIFSEFMSMGEQDILSNAQTEEMRFESANSQLKTSSTNWETNPSMKEIKIWALQKEEEVSTARPNREVGVSQEINVLKASDAKAMLMRAEAAEDRIISGEKVDYENFGFSEKVIIKDQVEKVIVKFRIEGGGFIHPEMKTSTIMESLINLGANVETAQAFGKAWENREIIEVRENGLLAGSNLNAPQLTMSVRDSQRRARRRLRRLEAAVQSRRIRI